MFCISIAFEYQRFIFFQKKPEEGPVLPNKASGGEMMKLGFLSLIMFSVVLCFASAQAREAPKKTAKKAATDPFVIIAPAGNAEVVGKRPEIKVEFAESLALESLVVLLDGIDITQVLAVTEAGFEYAPPLIVPAGKHTVAITAASIKGKPLEKSFSFFSRHTKTLVEAYSVNEATIIYENVADRSDEAVSAPSWKVQGNLMSDSKVRGKEWDVALNTNLRLLEHNRPFSSPEKEGLDTANWLLTGSHARESLLFRTSFGDVRINETPYTVSDLARRGGLVNLSYDSYRINLFTVKTQQVFGLKGVDITGTSDDHILGISGGIKFLDGKMDFRTVYASGGEPESSVGILTTPGPKKGNVLGFAMTTDFFESRLRTGLEADFSKFDPDTSDEFEKKSDKAYSFKAGGVLKKYNYEALYEYIGRDYAVVGNQMLQKDKEGLGLRGGTNPGVHGINLSLSRHNDNVRGDELFPTIVNYQGGIDYSYNKLQNLPLGINYHRSIQESTREPEVSSYLELHTDTYAGRVNYTAGAINLGFQTACSVMNDKSEFDSDTTTITYTLTPAYNTANMMLIPNFSLNRSKNGITDVRTDTYTITPDLKTKFFRGKASFDLGGAYNVVKADDGSIAGRTLNAGFRLGYEIQDILKGLVRPVIALRGAYLHAADTVLSTSNREFTLFLVLATTTPFAF